MKNRGFTMVELLISLAISSMIVGLILTFFIVNFKSYKSIKNDSELQYQSQYILNYMADKIVNSNSISLVKESNVREYSLVKERNAGVEYPINKISFSYGREHENYVFHIAEEENNIRYGNGAKDKTPSVELGNYVAEMYISLLKDQSFQDAKVLKLKIVMKKDGQKYEAFQTAYMRNN